ncbi:IS3 family transposase [Pedobacter arcticus]|uniref:IS3 family transposase n=1 Tax=Pedobacter arcticus TaxID=752140 RepID=UPI00058EF4A2|nr:IS3 family transposase [Pedobacter arcticus]
MLGMNRQLYYRAINSLNNKRTVAQKVTALVLEVRMRMPRLGTRKLYHMLCPELQNLGIGRDKLFRIMKANHLDIVPKRQYHITTDSHHRFRKHKNLVEHLRVDRPEQVWVSDITYIGTRKNPMYLSLVTDLYSKRIMGHDVSESLHATGAVCAIKHALKNRRFKDEELIHHSDRGLQYCCDEYQGLLADSRILCSMTERYDPYQNAAAERINGILKQEFIRGIQITDIQLMKKLIAQSIDIYNGERPHWSCFMNTPDQMHRQRTVRIRTYKTKNSIVENHNAI